MQVFDDSDGDLAQAIRESQREARSQRSVGTRGRASTLNGNRENGHRKENKVKNEILDEPKKKKTEKKKKTPKKAPTKEGSKKKKEDVDAVVDTEDDYDPFEDRVDEEEPSVGDEDEVQYKIQFILGSRKLSARQWKLVCESMCEYRTLFDVAAVYVMVYATLKYEVMYSYL